MTAARCNFSYRNNQPCLPVIHTIQSVQLGDEYYSFLTECDNHRLAQALVTKTEYARIIVSKEEETGNYIAFVDSLKGVHSQGSTVLEAYHRTVEALSVVIQIYLLDDTIPWSEPNDISWLLRNNPRASIFDIQININSDKTCKVLAYSPEEENYD